MPHFDELARPIYTDAPEQLGKVQQELDGQAEALDRLQEVASMLRKRLQPVLRPAENIAGATTGEHRENVAPVVERLQDLTSAIHLVTLDLQAVLGLLEV